MLHGKIYLFTKNISKVSLRNEIALTLNFLTKKKLIKKNINKNYTALLFNITLDINAKFLNCNTFNEKFNMLFMK